MRLERSDHRGDLSEVARGARGDRSAQTHILEHPGDLAAGKRGTALELLAERFGAAAAARKSGAPSQNLVRPGAPAIGPTVVGRRKSLREVGVVNVVLGLH